MFSKVFFLALIPAILAADHAVTVGANNALAFSPTSIVAAVGDTITFTCLAQPLGHIHVVLRRRLPSSQRRSGPQWIDSGFLSDLDGSQPTFTYTVVDTVPHFGACKQAAGAHCRAGMTFAINPNSTQTYAQFLANAKAS
ncbi:hypothetical protein B0H14DRAFT_3875733 [Mycena olivaceomarginata]|nr:hypothetical protein B0H14DRAFT_3875733 [Mycena olivaceomarginata]